MKTEVKKFRIEKYERVSVGKVRTIDGEDWTIIQIIDVEMDYEYGADVTALVYVSE